MLSPEEQRALMAMNWADWPEEAATAATPPSKAAMRCCQIDQVEGGYLLENVDGRVHDTGVDIPEFGQAEQIGGVLTIAELVARRLVDRDRDRIGRRVAPVPRMEHECFGMLALGRHLVLRGRAPARHFAMSGTLRVRRLNGENWGDRRGRNIAAPVFTR